MGIDQGKLLEEYIREAKESSKRVRAVVLVALAVSIVSFAGAWNVRPGNWMFIRKSMLTLAQSKMQDPRQIERARSLIDKINEISLANMTIKAPFFGVAFDVNDLGLIAGMTLLALVFVLRYCVRRELYNTRTVFTEAERLGALEQCYKLLSMSQVLIKTASLHDGRWGKRRHLVKLLYLPPAVVTLLLLGFDYMTLERALGEAPFMASFVFACSSAFTASIVWLTVSTIRTNLTLEREWASAAKKLEPVEKPSGGEDE